MADQQPITQPTQQSQSMLFRDDEIDLAELIAKIWSRKWWVVGIAALVAALAVVYVLVAKPIYKADVYLMPPADENLLELNQAGYIRILSLQSGEKAQRINSQKVYQFFLTQLESKTVKKDQLPAGYSLSIKRPKRGKAIFVSVSVQGGSPEVANIVNQYVDKVQRHTAELLASERRSQLEYLIEDTQRNLAIETELDAEQESENSLRRELAARLRYLQKITLTAERIIPVTIDQSAITPNQPIKPKKRLVVAVALVLGGMLGLFIALVVPVRKEETV